MRLWYLWTNETIAKRMSKTQITPHGIPTHPERFNLKPQDNITDITLPDLPHYAIQ